MILDNFGGDFLLALECLRGFKTEDELLWWFQQYSYTITADKIDSSILANSNHWTSSTTSTSEQWTTLFTSLTSNQCKIEDKLTIGGTANEIITYCNT